MLVVETVHGRPDTMGSGEIDKLLHNRYLLHGHDVFHESCKGRKGREGEYVRKSGKKRHYKVRN